MFPEFNDLFVGWSQKIQETLDNADAEKVTDKEPHPLLELEHWKGRMRRLTGIAE